MVSVIGRLKCLFEPPRTVTKSTPCTIPSLSACALVTLARGQSFLGASLQQRRTRSLFWTLRVMFCHFLCGCSVRRYSPPSRPENIGKVLDAFPLFVTGFQHWISQLAVSGVAAYKSAISLGSKLHPRLDRWRLERAPMALMIPDTSAIRVVKTSCVRCFGETSANMASNTRLVTPIILSHAPPVCDAWGGLNSHPQPSFSRYHLTGLASDRFSTA